MVAEQHQEQRPDDAAQEIEQDILFQGHPGQPRGDQHGQREAETHGYLGNEQDAITVFFVYLLDFSYDGRVDAEILAEFGDEPVRFIIADAVPDDITDQIARKQQQEGR